MSIGPEQEALIGRVFESYLTEHHHGDLLRLTAGGDEDAHRAVVVNAMTLFEANMEVGDYFNAYPHDVLAIFDKVLRRKVQESTGEADKRDERMRRTLHARITGLPVCPELTRVTVPRSRDVGHFLSLTGTVIRTSVAKVLEWERDYMCSKCRHVFTVQADFHQHYSFVPPPACPNPSGCGASNFLCLSAGSEPAPCRDYQEVKVQEQVQRLSVGSVPRSVVVVLEDDLVDSCKSGDDVTVFGVMCLRWRPLHAGARCDVELVLKANNMEVNNQQAAAALLTGDVRKEFQDYWSAHRHDPMAGRNRILLSLCPQVFGMYVIKLAVATVLAGGVQRTDASGTKIRGECHMLLVGDPGTGKSQFLKYAAKITPRSVLTAGIGSTSAGLTVAAVKDGGDWHLEAGALVLADGGLCCIDEFSSIKEHDRISIHEAMEQQSISVAKAGMVCKLNTRTTILAATNPKGPYNSSEPVSVNVALASPLLSRFDLVLVLLDTKSAEWDRVISSFILEDTGLPAESSGLWPMEKMKSYFSVIRGLQPQLSDDANRILARYYQLQRRSDGRNAARTTVRMLESLSRLAEAHARLMFRETVTIEDAVVAVSLMECSMQGGGLLGDVNALLTSFPDDASRQYRTQCELLLEGLNLRPLLHKEALRLDRLQDGAPGGVGLQGDQNLSLLTPDDPATFHPFTSTPRRPDRKSDSEAGEGTGPSDGPETPPCGSGGEGGGGGGPARTGSPSPHLGDQIQTDPGEDLRDQLSCFLFKPKKMRAATPPRPVARGGDAVKTTSSLLQKLSKAGGAGERGSSGAPGAVPPPRGEEQPGSSRKRRGDSERQQEANEDVSVRPPGHVQTAVGAAALAKLSRFSFASGPRDDAAAAAAVVHAPLQKKKRGIPGPDEPDESGRRGLLPVPHPPGGGGDGGGVRKRRCFQLNSSSHAALFSGPPELDAPAAGQDVFDTDWDREVI